jgi:hypothetical protein
VYWSPWRTSEKGEFRQFDFGCSWSGDGGHSVLLVLSGFWQIGSLGAAWRLLVIFIAARILRGGDNRLPTGRSVSSSSDSRLYLVLIAVILCAQWIGPLRVRCIQLMDPMLPEATALDLPPRAGNRPNRHSDIDACWLMPRFRFLFPEA